MARTEVTKEINSYIRQHQLQDKTNGRKIIPDAQLTKLLKIGSGDELTYFNLQRYMSPPTPYFYKRQTLCCVEKTVCRWCTRHWRQMLSL